jgi:dTDP-4-dehydrorhamnose 3,5-epimerase
MGKIEFERTGLDGVLLVSPQIFRDQRGFFSESYNYRDFSEIGIKDLFVQDNHSKSQKGVLRGLHYQYPHPQGKLVRVLKGKIFDVVVDIRGGSPSFGHYFGIRLSEDSPIMLYVPIGFAHGYLALEDDVEVMYKVTDFFHQEDDAGVRWNDPDIGIIWPYSELSLGYPILSDKDKNLPTLKDIQTPFIFPL